MNSGPFQSVFPRLAIPIFISMPGVIQKSSHPISWSFPAELDLEKGEVAAVHRTNEISLVRRADLLKHGGRSRIEPPSLISGIVNSS